jgi:hypothetical protein
MIKNLRQVSIISVKPQMPSPGWEAAENWIALNIRKVRKHEKLQPYWGTSVRIRKPPNRQQTADHARR